MITFLSAIFIKNKENTSNPKVRQSYGMLCGSVGIFLNIILFLGKFIAGSISHSISITADAFNNLSDAGSSIITLIGFKLSGQKPDVKHPFGHGRIEYISGFMVSITIIFMAFELIKTSFEKIIKPTALEYSPLILVILLVSILVKLYMTYYNTQISKRIDSSSMKATATDSLNDSLATLVVLIVTLITHFTSTTFPLDGCCGVLVGIFILISGINATKDTLAPLLGQAPNPQFVQRIEDIVMSHSDVLGIHDLVVHDYGPGRLMISLHAEVPATGDLVMLHDSIDNIEKDLQEELQCVATIHMDPTKNDDPETQLLKEAVQTILIKIDDSLSLHDFRIVSGPTHTNILFDIVVPFSCDIDSDELVSIVFDKIKDFNENYFAMIQIDKSYC